MEIQCNLADSCGSGQEPRGFIRRSCGPWTKRNIQIIKEGKFRRRWSVGLISSSVLRCEKLGLTSQIIFPEIQPLFTHAGQMRCSKSRTRPQDKPSRQLVLNGCSRGAPKQSMAAKMSNRHRECPEATYNTGNAYSAQDDVEGLPCAGKNLVQLPMTRRRDEALSLDVRETVRSHHYKRNSNIPQATTVDARTIVTDRKTPSNRSRGVGHGHDQFACSCKKETDKGTHVTLHVTLESS